MTSPNSIIAKTAAPTYVAPSLAAPKTGGPQALNPSLGVGMTPTSNANLGEGSKSLGNQFFTAATLVTPGSLPVTQGIGKGARADFTQGLEDAVPTSMTNPTSGPETLSASDVKTKFAAFVTANDTTVKSLGIADIEAKFNAEVDKIQPGTTKTVGDIVTAIAVANDKDPEAVVKAFKGIAE